MLTDHDDPWFRYQHAPEFTPAGTLLLFDNGDIERAASRVVEYALDEQALTAEIVWEYPGDLGSDRWYTNKWGDADRLPGGTTLITAASPRGRGLPAAHLRGRHGRGNRVGDVAGNGGRRDGTGGLPG